MLYHELEHLKMCLGTVTDMNETLNKVPGDNSDGDIALGCGKKLHNGLIYTYIPIIPTLSEESAIPMVADEDATDHILKNPPPCGRSHVFAHVDAIRT